MKSMARGVAETIGCQHSTGRLTGRHERQFLKLVAAIGHAGRQRIVLAAMGEAFAVEGLEQDLDLLLEDLAVGVLVKQRAAKGLDLARVIAAAHAEDGAAPGQDVGDGVVLGEPERMPHRGDVEAAAHLQPLGDVCQMHRQYQEVG